MGMRFPSHFLVLFKKYSLNGVPLISFVFIRFYSIFQLTFPDLANDCTLSPPPPPPRALQAFWYPPSNAFVSFTPEHNLSQHSAYSGLTPSLMTSYVITTSSLLAIKYLLDIIKAFPKRCVQQSTF